MNLTKILILSKIENNNNFDIFSNHKMEEIVLLFELDKYKFLFIDCDSEGIVQGLSTKCKVEKRERYFNLTNTIVLFFFK